MHDALTAYSLALLIGMVAGLRSMTAPALASWLAHLGSLHLAGTWLAFLGYVWTPWILTAFALGELIIDKLPATPSRKAPGGFAARIVTGGVSGAAIATAAAGMIVGIIAGIAGAVIGTLGGHAFRARLAAAFGKDRPAALIEDVIAVGGALLIGMALR
jgi:uncharacterized membrane protein